jgi:5,5'-dehydrodivanillate O-demethylase oxygenase subunit
MAVTRHRDRLSKVPDYKDFVHTGPDTLSGRYMRLFWQPVCRSKDLELGHTKPIRIMSENFTLYRGEEGAPHVVDFRCAHRGTQLSAGWVEGDCLRCVYHGWKYDGSGQCIEQPAEEKSFARKIRIRSCPTKEYLGLIFAYFGEGEPPPLPRYPHFEVEGILDTLPNLLWPCNYFQHLENAGDAAHLPFTHRDSYFSADARSGIPTGISRAETSWGLVTRVNFPGGATQIYNFGMPNIHDIRIPAPDPEIPWDDRIAWTIPIDDDLCLTFRVRHLPVTGDAAARYLERQRSAPANSGPSSEELGESVLAGRIRFQDLRDSARTPIAYVNAQDYVAQVGQGSIADRTREHLGRSDLGVILFRKIWERELRALKRRRRLKKWTPSMDKVAERGLATQPPA